MRIGIAIGVENLVLSSESEIVISCQNLELRFPSGREMVFGLAEPSIESWIVHVDYQGDNSLGDWEVIEVGSNLYHSKGNVLKGVEKWFIKRFETREEALRVREQLSQGEIFSYIKRRIEQYGDIKLSSGGKTWRLQTPLYINPKDGIIRLHDVVYGGGFHWERREVQTYGGEFVLYAYPEGITLVNILDAEEYLMVVNSSEMHPDLPIDVLKAQTIAARSTLVSTRGKHHFGEPFDLCNTDHCQVYRGLQRVKTRSREAVEQTHGEILVLKNELVDARYAKTCGGVTEDKTSVWGGRKLDYLISHPDNHEPITIKTEEDVVNFINTYNFAYCNIDPSEIPCIGDPLFRWQIDYEDVQLVRIIRKKMGIEFHRLNRIEIAKRGYSGRAVVILLHTDRGTFKIFTELEIRSILSESHLPSSLFYIERDGSSWVFHGAGWGHGVGMCQVGAVGMAIQGKTYHEILYHYYPGTEIVRIW